VADENDRNDDAADGTEAEDQAEDQADGQAEDQAEDQGEASGTDEASDAYAAEVRKRAAGPALDYEARMDEYPLRDAEEDPRWALWVVGIWTTFAIGSIVFILVLIVLGAIYD
jgi:hypothetical protein